MDRYTGSWDTTETMLKMALNLHHMILNINDPEKEGFWKHIAGKKRKYW